MDDIRKKVIQYVAKTYKPIAYKEKKVCVWCGDNVIADYYKRTDKKPKD